MTTSVRDIGSEAVDLCQKLVRIDTSNPPGHELPAAQLLARYLTEAGIETQVLESAPGRANVVARLRGSGEASGPLLLASHLDVVPADPPRWRKPPFSGEIDDGFLWGRGALDMKNMVAMTAAIVAELARAKRPLRRDIIFAAVADEEMGCQHGSSWLCEHHPELVRAEYGIGEGGGFDVYVGLKKFRPIGVAEKGYAWVRGRVRGEPGHGSMPREDSAIVRMTRGLARLSSRGLPVHLTPVVMEFFDGIAQAQPPWLRSVFDAVRVSGALPHLLKRLPDKSTARAMAAMVSNTACPTIIQAGDKTNMIPATAEVQFDARTLPGQTDVDLLRELQRVLGPHFELEVLHSAPPVQSVPLRTPLFDAIVGVLAEREPEGTPLPYMLPGFTDAKGFTKLGVRWVGFAPVRLPKGVRFAELIHGDNERIPVEGLRWGAHILAEIIERFAVGS